MVGTDDYLPPEVRDLKDGSGNPFNPEKVDIFTLGITFFILIFGHLPFRKAYKYDEFYIYIYK